MKLYRYTRADTPDAMPRLGLPTADGAQLADLQRACARMLEAQGKSNPSGDATRLFPGDVAGWLENGALARTALNDVADWLAGHSGDDAEGLDGNRIFVPFDGIALHAPICPPKMLAVGRNYNEHKEEMYGHKITEMPKVPAAWVKSNNTICGPTDHIVKPYMTQKLDYETELCVVIAKRCKNVLEAQAWDVVAGYTIMSDITARDVGFIERAEGNRLLGKMFDTFGPMGPCFVTADAIEDPHALGLRTRVNGEVRQDGSTADMIWSIPQFLSYVSQMTLEAGDLVLTGTPSGVANGHKVEGENWFLQDDDVLESEIDGIGTMRNRIVDEAEGPRSWNWNALIPPSD
jgi:acylpyruvate hydrolase